MEMEQNNEEVFNQVDNNEFSEEVQPTTYEPETTNSNEEDDLIEEDFKPKLSNQSEKEKEEKYGKKAEADGRELTIKEISITAPKTKKKDANGNVVKIDPDTTISGKAQYYPAKLKVRYEEDNLVEYYPTIRFWVNDGQISENVKLDRNGNSKSSQMIRMIMEKMCDGKFKLESKKVNDKPTWVVTKGTQEQFDAVSKILSDQEIIDWAKGKKVKIETSSGTYNGSDWFRNDWKELL